MNNLINEYILHISEPCDNAQIVYTARYMLADMGFDQSRLYLVATAVSELSTNIIRYAHQGTITLRSMMEGATKTFEVIAEDAGPGITDISKALEQHYSTGNGLGIGLPSVQRIMDSMEIWSEPQRGTRIVARKVLD